MGIGTIVDDVYPCIRRFQPFFVMLEKMQIMLKFDFSISFQQFFTHTTFKRQPTEFYLNIKRKKKIIN